MNYWSPFRVIEPNNKSSPRTLVELLYLAQVVGLKFGVKLGTWRYLNKWGPHLREICIDYPTDTANDVITKLDEINSLTLPSGLILKN